MLHAPCQTKYIFHSRYRNNMKEIALSMLTLTRDGYHKFAIDPKDITKLAKDFQWNDGN